MGFEHILIDRSGVPHHHDEPAAPPQRAVRGAHARADRRIQPGGRQRRPGIILAGAGPVFSAGHDFADVAKADLQAARRLLRTCTELMALIQSVPQPVVARVHGLATAAGCQLVASCDLAVARGSAAFAAPGGKGGWFCHTPMVAIARNVGRKRAAELALTGDAISARQALDWGLVNPSRRTRSSTTQCTPC